jgi:hypothetical protein
MRVRLSPNAVTSFRERVCPWTSAYNAHKTLERLLEDRPLGPAPEWLRVRRPDTDGYVQLAADCCVPIRDGCAVACLVDPARRPRSRPRVAALS